MQFILADTIIDMEKNSDLNQKLELIKQKEDEIKYSTIYENQIVILYENYVFTISEDLKIISVTEEGQANIDLDIEKKYYTAHVVATISGLNIENLTIESIQKEGEEIPGNEANFDFDKPGEYKIIIKLSNGTKVEKLIEMEEISQFDLFDYCSKTGKSLSYFGLKSSWSNSERKTFALWNVGAGKWNGSGNYSGTFTIAATSIKEIILFNNVYANFMLQADGSATIYGRIVVNYTDGTNSSKNTATRTKGAVGQYVSYPAEVSVNKDKIISSIQFIIAGTDKGSAGAQGYIKEILLRNV